jgi:hypothetical protein
MAPPDRDAWPLDSGYLRLSDDQLINAIENYYHFNIPAHHGRP